MTKNSGVTGKTVLQQARVLGAIIRRAARAERSVADQLALIDERPGQSAKERLRLVRGK